MECKNTLFIILEESLVEAQQECAKWSVVSSAQKKKHEWLLLFGCKSIQLEEKLTPAGKLIHVENCAPFSWMNYQAC